MAPWALTEAASGWGRAFCIFVAVLLSGVQGGLFNEERCVPTAVLPALRWPRVRRPSAQPCSALSALEPVGRVSEGPQPILVNTR